MVFGIIYTMKINKEITDEQIDWSITLWGMMGDGCSMQEALGYILLMECPTEIYAWLVKEVRKSRYAGEIH